MSTKIRVTYHGESSSPDFEARMVEQIREIMPGAEDIEVNRAASIPHDLDTGWYLQMFGEGWKGMVFVEVLELVEGAWTCAYCGTEQLSATLPGCPQCGATRQFNRK